MKMTWGWGVAAVAAALNLPAALAQRISDLGQVRMSGTRDAIGLISYKDYVYVGGSDTPVAIIRYDSNLNQVGAPLT